VIRRSISVLLTLTCAVHGPSLAWAGPPEDVDARAEGLFNEGKYLEAAELQVAALKALPESLANRPQRNLWATGAVNAYLQVFTADPTQCTAATAGLAVADDYLKALLGEYGASVARADEYTGMQRLHGELDEARARNGCPAPGGAPATVATDAVEPEPTPRPGPSSAPVDEAPPRKPDTRGLAAGIGVSAAASVGMTIGSIITYRQLRKDPGSGNYYDDIYQEAKTAGFPVGADSNMCRADNKAANDRLDAACSKWDDQKRVFLATTVLASVFAASTVVFTGLLIHKRWRPGPTTALLHQHQARLGVMPHRGGGASLSMGFRF
jgi:hypothetical protein